MNDLGLRNNQIINQQDIYNTRLAINAHPNSNNYNFKNRKLEELDFIKISTERNDKYLDK
jgi:hypothetical protein